MAKVELRQPDVSKNLNGNVSGFSVWRLLQTLKGLGERVTISIEAPEPGESRTLAMSL
jgi:predicted XRE-type DNA-binding protein